MTHTHTKFFDSDEVDRLVGGAYKALTVDFEMRRPFIDKHIAQAADHRLELLRHTWALLLDDAD
jgi:hypothetical protein